MTRESAEQPVEDEINPCGEYAGDDFAFTGTEGKTADWFDAGGPDGTTSHENPNIDIREDLLHALMGLPFIAHMDLQTFGIRMYWKGEERDFLESVLTLLSHYGETLKGVEATNAAMQTELEQFRALRRSVRSFLNVGVVGHEPGFGPW